ncbi:MAG: phosphoglycerate dehydrogenase [Chloroflexi bacterium]|nr:phosphoglycerate dehydrogenase [Chloroflexota bacterium]
MAVLVVDPIAADGVDALARHTPVDVRLGLSREAFFELIPGYEGLVVRSETKVTADVIRAGTKLQVIGRAGVGVDNIDVDAATARGIVVVNAPAGNTIAVAEHTLGLIIAAARNIPQASAALREGRWERSKFMGVEIHGKTLGVLGLGRIGTEVAKRALGFEMRLIAHDPYVSQEHASRIGVGLVDFDTLLAESDFLTIHVPATPQTDGVIGKTEFTRMKPTAWIVNCSRGGIVDEDALLDALDLGAIAGAALDVFREEPATNLALLRHPRIVTTPHLAASTVEAQVNVAVELAEQIVAVLEGRPAAFAVNAPAVSAETARVLTPYAQMAQVLGNLATQLAEGQLRRVEITYSGEIAEYDTAAPRAAVIRGLLQPISEETVTLVNATIVARNRGLNITERKSGETENYANLITVRVETDRGRSLVGGTIIAAEPHIVRIDDYWVSVVPTGGYVLLTHHTDQPGMIGRLGTILGENDINISAMQVGRERPRGPALMLSFVDDPIPPKVFKRIREIPGFEYVKAVRI